MVAPITIEIPPSLDGATEISLPNYKGVDMIVDRRGVGKMKRDEYANTELGGLKLLKVGDMFHTGEVLTIWDARFFTNSTIQAGVQQYPYSLMAVLPNEATIDEEGNITLNGDANVFQSPCRPEIRSGSQYIQGISSEMITFYCIIYMPLGTMILQPGMIVEVKDKDAAVIIQDTIKQFSKGQLNQRIWV